MRRAQGEFEAVVQTLDYVSGVHVNFREFSQFPECLYEAM